MNPAWMTRQVFDLINEEAKLPFLSHLTSLKNVNPANRPDAWEERGLLAFDRGAREISEEVEINGRRYMRFLKPFVTEEGCIKCHGSQGYRVGDIRGGMSIAVPMEPYLQAEALQVRTIVASHFLFWVIGTAGIVLYSRATKRQQETMAERSLFRATSLLKEGLFLAAYREASKLAEVGKADEQVLAVMQKVLEA